MTDHNDERERRSSYYYSYGPYNSRGQANERDESVEVVVPPPVRTYQNGGVPAVKRNLFASKFFMFLLGALVVGGLMFAADQANLFGGDQQQLMSAADEDPLLMNTASGANRNGAVSSGNSGGNGTSLNANSPGVIRPGNISDIVDRTSNAVVKIETTIKASSGMGGSFFNDPFFDRFFGDSFGDNGGEQNGGMGSGFIFDKAGYILTNEHVIDGADKIFVKLEGSDKKYPAKLLGTAFDLDLAVLKIEGKNDFPTIKMGNSDEARVGDWVIAIGNPYGFEHTVTVGVLSAKERPISIPDTKGQRDYKNLLQTDASINPGNSGGPLLNLKGEVIGINTAVSAQAQGIGFAIPTSTISGVLDSLKANKKIVRPYMGVRLQDIDRSWVSELGLRNTNGSVIMQVESGSPAAKAGLQPYDVVLRFNGKTINSTKDLQAAVQAQKPGDRVRMVIVRDGRNWAASVILGKQEVGLSR